MNATTQQTPSSVPMAEEGFDILKVVIPLWRGKWVILISLVVCISVSLYKSFHSTPVYHATAVLSPVEIGEKQGSGFGASLGGLASIVGVNSAAASANVNNALAVCRSRRFKMLFIEKHNLLPILRESTRDYLGKMDSLTLLDGAVMMQWAVKAEFEGGLVMVRVYWSDPVVAAEWANFLIEDLNTYLREKAISEADSSINYLKNEILRTPVPSMQEMLNRLIERQIEAITLAKVRTQYAFNIIDHAIPPTDMDSPNRKKDAIKGAATGLLLGLGIIFGFLMFRNFRQKLADVSK